ncbi:hypothetical protein FNV43_RR08767 [Rhamnella rubrinervis]|uniref:Uncharacterized protein n=1 Tax=Rhamnella rubrinervis TaxID=2594499 RepID=A0A8K0H9E3_9ROSA|nr:hypothetical protein FNV43_RR08767 [Rhamnella rubrinervis]
MATSSLFSPSSAPSNPVNDHELLFSGDPKYALHGEIVMLVIFLLFITIFIVFLFFLYTKYRPYTHPKLGDSELVVSKNHLKGQIEDGHGFNLFTGPI